MAIYFADEFLESQIEQVRISRGDRSLAKTARDLLRETLTQRGVISSNPQTDPAPASSGAGEDPTAA